MDLKKRPKSTALYTVVTSLSDLIVIIQDTCQHGRQKHKISHSALQNSTSGSHLLNAIQLEYRIDMSVKKKKRNIFRYIKVQIVHDLIYSNILGRGVYIY